MKRERTFASIGLFSLLLAVVSCTGGATEPRGQISTGVSTNSPATSTSKNAAESTQHDETVQSNSTAPTNSSVGTGAGSSSGSTVSSGLSNSGSSSGNYSSSATPSSAAASPSATPATSATTAPPASSSAETGVANGVGDGATAAEGTGAATPQALKARIAARQADLQRERDRNGRLRAELMLTRNGGCWSEQRLKKLEVEINGSHLSNGQAQRSSSAKQSRGNAGQMKIVFSEMLSIVIENEEQQQLFSPSGRYITQDFANNLIREIAMIKVVKGGVAYTSSRVSLPCFMGMGCWTGYDSFETNRYSLGGMTIKINDQIFYKRTNINYTFEGDKREWNEGSIGSNPDYLRLMSRQDCPAAQ